MKVPSGGNAYDWFFAAVAHARLGERDKARALCEEAIAWTAEHAPGDEELRRFREEAAELLGAK